MSTVSLWAYDLLGNSFFYCFGVVESPTWSNFKKVQALWLLLPEGLGSGNLPLVGSCDSYYDLFFCLFVCFVLFCFVLFFGDLTFRLEVNLKPKLSQNRDLSPESPSLLPQCVLKCTLSREDKIGNLEFNKVGKLDSEITCLLKSEVNQ